MLSGSEAAGSAAVVTSLSAQGIVISSSVLIDVRCPVRDAIVQWDAVVSTVGENVCGWAGLVVDSYGSPQISQIQSLSIATLLKMVSDYMRHWPCCCSAWL